MLEHVLSSSNWFLAYEEDEDGSEGVSTDGVADVHDDPVVGLQPLGYISRYVKLLRFYRAKNKQIIEFC